MPFSSRNGGAHALPEDHLSIAQGEFTRVGPSGSGKSTVLKLESLGRVRNKGRIGRSSCAAMSWLKNRTAIRCVRHDVRQAWAGERATMPVLAS
jgi:ABC-type lipoprotein export system ATPase subunit